MTKADKIVLEAATEIVRLREELRAHVPCQACAWSEPRPPEKHEEPPIVRGALDAQEEAERRATKLAVAAEHAQQRRTKAAAEVERLRGEVTGWRDWAEDTLSTHGAMSVPPGTDAEVMDYLAKERNRIDTERVNVIIRVTTAVDRWQRGEQGHGAALNAIIEALAGPAPTPKGPGPEALPLIDATCEYCGDDRCPGRDHPERCIRRPASGGSCPMCGDLRVPESVVEIAKCSECGAQLHASGGSWGTYVDLPGCEPLPDDEPTPEPPAAPTPDDGSPEAYQAAERAARIEAGTWYPPGHPAAAAPLEPEPLASPRGIKPTGARWERALAAGRRVFDGDNDAQDAFDYIEQLMLGHQPPKPTPAARSRRARRPVSKNCCSGMGGTGVWVPSAAVRSEATNAPQGGMISRLTEPSTYPSGVPDGFSVEPCPLATEPGIDHFDLVLGEGDRLTGYQYPNERAAEEAAWRIVWWNAFALRPAAT